MRNGEAEVMVDGEASIEAGASPNNTTSKDKPNNKINLH